MFTNILVPTDFSECADAALDKARAIAAKFGGTLRLLHVMPDPLASFARSMEGYVPDLTDVCDAMRSNATERLQACLTPHDRTAFHATADTFFGTPAFDIVDYATMHGVDLIVMGTHGRTGMQHLLIGSVAERVVRTAPCTVMTVRALKPAAVRAA